MLLISSLDGLNGGAAVTTLQEALVKLGKQVSVTGVVDDKTIAALWTVLKGNLTKARDVAKLISADASKAVNWLVTAMDAVDSTVSKVPFLTTAKLLANWANINSVANAACGDNSICLTAAEVLVDGRKAVVAGITDAAGVFTKVVTAFGTPPTPPAPSTSTGTSQPSTNPILRAMQRARARADWGGKTTPGTATAKPPGTATAKPPGTATAKPPARVPLWAVLGAIGLIGGVLVARRGAA
jgi:hypothetical protein